MTAHPSGFGGEWFVGAWRRRSIALPGGDPSEPCEAWWVQTDGWFVDVRVAQPGYENNTLPFSSTRAFAGRFTPVDGGFRWFVELDSDGITPRVDGTAGVDLSIDADDPSLMIEDAPDRFSEEWVQGAQGERFSSLQMPQMIAVRVGNVRAVVWTTDSDVCGRVTQGEWSITVGPDADPPAAATEWWA